MSNRTFEEQLRLLSQNAVPEAWALLNKLEELASERSHSSIEWLLSQFEIAEKRRVAKIRYEAAEPMTRLQILQYYRINGAWPRARRIQRTQRSVGVRGNAHKIREVRRYVGDYIY
jgi:hypothetical protein